MRVLICGSRTWDDWYAIRTVLAGCLDEAVCNFDTLTIIEGCARGADSVACHFYDGPCEFDHAAHDHVAHEHYPAEWERFGNAAGPIRNQRMLDEGKPEVVYAFTNDLANSKGTADMVRRARKAGVRTYVIGLAP